MSTTDKDRALDLYRALDLDRALYLEDAIDELTSMSCSYLAKPVDLTIRPALRAYLDTVTVKVSTLISEGGAEVYYGLAR